MMHYGKDRPAILKYDPFKAIISPRPIGWIGTVNKAGTANIAPYSFFAALSARPNMVVFSSDGAKHSYLNAKASGEFTFSLATDELKHAMNMTSEDIPEGESEFETARLTPVPGVEVAAPFVGESPAALECVVVSAQELEDRHGTPTSRYIVIGEVVRTHIRDEYIDENGRFDTLKAKPIARLGYKDYSTVDRIWELDRPSGAQFKDIEKG
jgi:flavin reductase (DIM6/NTAB) family NADH-FMN oxidoreductase RutF